MKKGRDKKCFGQVILSSDIINKISNKLKNEKGEDKLENYCLKEKISYFN